jgi:hypothetical protein
MPDWPWCPANGTHWLTCPTSETVTTSCALACAILHRGSQAPDLSERNEIVRAVNDFLYLLDWLHGHEWAFDHLTPETSAAFDG